jgi:hypothetical protein
MNLDLQGDGMQYITSLRTYILGKEHWLYMVRVISRDNACEFPPGWIIIECSGYSDYYQCEDNEEISRALANPRNFLEKISDYWASREY